MLYSGPRKPKNQTKVIYNIGWWAYQERLTIERFEVVIIESRLNLLNSNSLISYTIEGSMTNSKHWKPYLKNIHRSERFVNDSTERTGVFELTPVVATKENKDYQGELIKFKTTNELLIKSFHWGSNKLIFKCGEFQKEIELKQVK